MPISCRFHFEAEDKEHFINVLRNRFNAGITYKGRALKWEIVIEQKTRELGRFLIGRSSTLAFMEPAPKLRSENDQKMRVKILALTIKQASHIGIGKTTFHYLQSRVRSSKSLTLYKSVSQRLSE